MAVLLGLGLLVFGCARVHVPLASKRPDGDNRSKNRGRPDNTRTVGKRPIGGAKVAAKSAAGPQFEPITGDLDKTGRRGSDDKGNVFAAFNRKRVAEEDDFAVDPFLAESGKSVENLRAEFLPPKEDERAQPARSPAGARDRHQAQAGQQGHQVARKRNKFADGFDLQIERLRAAADTDEEMLEQATAWGGPSALNDVETGHSSRVEYLPPPPLSAPSSRDPFGEMIVDTEMVPSRSWRVESRESRVESRESEVESQELRVGSRESRVASREIPTFNAQDSIPNRLKWPPPVEFDGSITPAPGQEVVTAEEEIQLAEIVPGRRSGRALPAGWSPQPNASRVMANRGSDLRVRPSADLPSLLPVDRTAEAGSAGRIDLPPAPTPYVFKKTEPVESPDSQEPAEGEKTPIESQTPPPPAESQTASESRGLEPVSWDDAPEAGSGQDYAAIPSPVLFGFGVGLAFLIGLAIRRRNQLRAG